MKVESLLPLGKLDPGLREPDTPLDIRDFARLSKVAEDVGLDAVLVEETKDDPFQMMALRATTTERIQLGTSVAMAFPRSPTAIAMSAWSLAKLSGVGSCWGTARRYAPTSSVISTGLARSCTLDA